MRNFFAGKFAAQNRSLKGLLTKDTDMKITGTHLGIFVMITYFILNIWITYDNRDIENESEDSVSERSDRKRQEP